MTRLAILALLLLPTCDKVAHLGAGFIIGGAVTEATESRPLGCLASIIVGAAKEAIGGVPDPLDFVATAAGGCLSLDV